jgi:hypothetical protein
MKWPRITFAGSLLVLFLFGFLAGYSPGLTGIDFRPKTIGLTLGESLFSLVCLLVLCLTGARVILWGYSRSRLSGPPALIFMLSLFILITSAVIRLSLEFQQFEYYSALLADRLEIEPLSMGSINYFVTAFNSVFLPAGIIVIILLWISYWHEKREDHA